MGPKIFWTQQVNDYLLPDLPCEMTGQQAANHGSLAEHHWAKAGATLDGAALMR
jgi:hypothetical protein